MLDHVELDASFHVALAVVAVAVALVGTWLLVRLLLFPLRRLLRRRRGAATSRSELLGRLCVIRTGRVGPEFGQAEVRADDGSSVLVQVRHPENNPLLRAGSSAVIYSYDAAREIFWVSPLDFIRELDRDHPAVE
ncbi:hypothetical protein CcI49_07115 [Frankia sp. CcI49]|uniref:OB-fold-containig protein n=1 Tax=unclassified Frankia TaxID=2632575 RepID=UPI0006CA0EEF|nr:MULTISPECIES: OB-fold-containig protein [unclassified Frankia]KPM54719.1 hypothetical protein ACG83_14790 [Frankia sp. R43]ONH61345.1 hypothetical protein CcI49_07115 [Frankia sp. CcI49]